MQGTMKKYIVTATYQGSPLSSFSLESINNPELAMKRFLNFFLVRRSGFFDLSLEDKEDIIETIQSLEVDDPSKTDVEFQYQVTIKDKPLIVSFFPMGFVL